MTRYHNLYKTEDGKKIFVFRYVNIGTPSNQYYQIDIISQPGYENRDNSMHTTHRLPSGRPGCNYKICVYDHATPRSLDDAMRLSMSWAELTWKYIQTGITLDEQISRNARR